jgi:hypothetical protein
MRIPIIVVAFVAYIACLHPIPARQLLSTPPPADSSFITKPDRTNEKWADILNKMIGRSLVLPDEDGDSLRQGLSANFAPSRMGKPVASPATAAATPRTNQAAPSSTAQSASSAAASYDLPTVNLIKASAPELQVKLGIIANEAEFVRYREQNGNVKGWEKVSPVSGVTIEQIKENQKRLSFECKQQ